MPDPRASVNPDGPASLLLRDFTLFDGVTEDLHEGMSLVAESGRIVEIARKPTVLDGAHKIDCRGMFLMPGLIDLHFHAYSVDGSAHRLDRMPAALRVCRAVRMLEAALLRGFTSVRDPGGGDVGLYLAIEHGLIAGPRLFFGGKALSQTGGHGDMRPSDLIEPCACGYSGVISTVVDGPDHVRKVARETLRQGAHHLKLFLSGGISSPTDPVWMPQFTDEEIRAAVEEARTRRRYVAAHCHTDDAARRCVELGVRSIEHGTDISSATAGRIATSGSTYVVPTLAVLEQLRLFGGDLGLPAGAMEKARAVPRRMLESIERCMKAGVKLGLGTDLIGETHQYLQSREPELRAEVCRPIDVLRSATSINAEILQMSGELGVVAVGAWADVILIDGNPLQDLSLLGVPERSLQLIVKGGRIVCDRL